MSRRLLLVLAHPDDEAMGNGTLITRHVRAGCEVHLVCATRGGAGWTGRPAGRSAADLPQIRTQELACAAGVLGLAGYELWDYPDGGVPGCDQEEITGRIRAAVERLDPQVVVGWGPDGGYGHADHIAVGACTDRALAGSQRPHYHMAIDRATADAFARLMRAQGMSEDGMPLRPVPSVDLVFDASPEELAVVRRAVECHDSQRNAVIEAVLAEDTALTWMARNSYVAVSGRPTSQATELLPELRSE